MNGGGAGLGAQFDISVTGNAEASLARIAGALNTVQDAAGDVAVRVSDAANKINLMIQAGMGIEDFGRKMSYVGNSILRFMMAPLTGIIKDMTEIETLTIGLRSAFRNLDDSGFKELEKRINGIAVKSPFAQKEVIDLVKSMQNVAGIDFSQQFKGVKGFSQSGIEFLTDLAAGAGRSIEQVTYSIREFLSNPAGSAAQFMSFKRRLDIGGKEQIEAALKSVGERADFSNQQKSLETMFKFVSIKFGGLTKDLTTSMGGMVSNLKDAISIGMREMAGPFFDSLKKVMRRAIMLTEEFFDSSTEKGKRFIDSMKSFFATMGSVVEFIADKVFVVVRALMEFTAQNPLLAKTLFITVGLAGVILSIGGAVLTLIGIMTKFTGSIMGLNGAMTLGRKIALMFAAGLKTVSLSALALVGIPALLYYAWKMNFGGIQEFVEDVMLVLKGLFALISSNEGEFGKIPVELAEALQKAGLWDMTVALFKVFGRLRLFFIGFWEGFKTGTTEAVNIFLALMKPVVAVVKWLADLFGVVLFEASKTGAEGWKEWGLIIGKVIGYAIVFIPLIWGIVQAFSVLGAVIAIATSPITLWIVAIAAVVAAVWWLYNNWKTVVDFMKFLWQEYGAWIAAGAAIMFGPIVGGILLLIRYWDEVMNFFKSSYDVIVNIFSAIAGAIMVPINAAKAALDSVWQFLLSIIQKIPDMFLPESLEKLKVQAANPTATVEGLATGSSPAQSAGSQVPDVATAKGGMTPAAAAAAKSPTVIQLNVDGRQLHKVVVDQDRNEGIRSFEPQYGY